MSDVRMYIPPNKDYQADFAQRLVNAVGFENAIRECYENQWLGTLIHVRYLQQRYGQQGR
ncbi:hypothetical protein GCM10011332_29040 [Terasakiella brassicae]|uniref:Uncharacterized protein n=1 Tax=Terasakiella brassicae TaxID=1634917 RepID=A0A917FEB0_9PROT|nr:hypothetical protein [Terasakiella brassicae]GGF73196.1 hypothetical protein GCM10011332_29040 [Terasakiella brassicae]